MKCEFECELYAELLTDDEKECLRSNIESYSDRVKDDLGFWKRLARNPGLQAKGLIEDDHVVAERKAQNICDTFNELRHSFPNLKCTAYVGYGPSRKPCHSKLEEYIRRYDDHGGFFCVETYDDGTVRVLDTAIE